MLSNNTIVVATHNKGKMKEFAALAERLGLNIITRDEAGVPHDFDVVEDGTTFEENSFKKAFEIMQICKRPTMSDDSGLMVDALDGAPGVYSARFGGVDGDDMKNKEKLLSLMKDVPEDKRTAHFETVITLVYPDETGMNVAEKIVAKGQCFGRITTEMRGSEGFGYDPVFAPDEADGSTFAELGVDFKNTISHRAKALQQLEKMLAER